MSEKKPPLGVAPHWYVYPKRMTELSEAIKNYVDYAIEIKAIKSTVQVYKAIASWCEELKTLCLLEAKIEEREKKQNDPN